MSVLCTQCTGSTSVTDSRAQPDGTVRRRRACGTCGLTFSTVERAVDGVDYEAKYHALVAVLQESMGAIEHQLAGGGRQVEIGTGAVSLPLPVLRASETRRTARHRPPFRVHYAGAPAASFTSDELLRIGAYHDDQ